jgi:hypothetical protein
MGLSAFLLETRSGGLIGFPPFCKKNSKVLNHQPDFVRVSGNLLPKRRKETALFATYFAATTTTPPKSGKDVQVCR